MQQSSRNHTHLFRMFHLHQTVASIPDPERCTDLHLLLHHQRQRHGLARYYNGLQRRHGVIGSSSLLLFPGHLRMWLFLPLLPLASGSLQQLFPLLLSLPLVVCAAVVLLFRWQCFLAHLLLRDPQHLLRSLPAISCCFSSLCLLSVCLSYVLYFAVFIYLYSLSHKDKYALHHKLHNRAISSAKLHIYI